MSKTRGMTLVEVMIAMAILAIMVAFVFLVVHNAVTQAERTSTGNDMAGRGRDALDEIRRLVGYARIVKIGATFTAPDTHDHAGLEFRAVGTMDADGVGNFGWYDTAGTFMENWSAEIYFEASQIHRESSGAPILAPGDPVIPAGTTETIEDRDLNGDGDQLDTFVRGHLWLRTFSALAPPVPPPPAVYTAIANSSPLFVARRVLDDYVVLAADAAGLLQGDVDNDGTTDPLFTIINDVGGEIGNTTLSTAGRRIRVNIWHAAFDERHMKFILRRNTEDIRLEQDQSP